MSFIKPQFASPLPIGWKPAPGEWVAEQKYDGHRLVVEVRTPLFEGRSIDQLAHENVAIAWSRNGARRVLPRHVYDALAQLPVGIYDGELCVPGGRSYGVTELVQQDKLVYVAFDLLRTMSSDITGISYDDRRGMLELIFSVLDVRPAVVLAEQWDIGNWDAIVALRNQMWSQDKEGLILKRRASRYCSGKRPKDWLKVKQLQSAVFEVIGFEPGRGEVNDRGPFAVVRLKDAEGRVTSCKTLNDKELAKFQKEWNIEMDLRDDLDVNRFHPVIGRRLRCEFQERTPDGLYRHIRWDRWEDE